MTTPKKRRVRALQDCYVEHIYRLEGSEFEYGGPGQPDIFLELDDGDTSSVSASVPRKPGERAGSSGLADLLS
tara:strand:+ start:649 stop:867 length:219 start_codon:yes stop_codon:yes gene_type:complete